MKKLVSIVIAAAMLLSCVVTVSAQSEEAALQFGSDGQFTVLQISDPQDDHYPAYDMVNFIKLAIEQTNPDLVVFSGDIVEDSRIGDMGIDGESGREGVKIEGVSGFDYEQTLANVKAASAAVFEETENKGIPFAVVQGNNDYNSGITNEDWLKIYSEYETCLVNDESADSDGRIDYNLEIKSSDGSKTAFNIWLMDTKKSSVTDEQLDWYKTESAALKAANGGEAVPSILFQHIPTADVGNLFEECNIWDDGARAVDGKFYRLNKEIASGYCSFASVPAETSEQFKAWKECGDVLGAYFGHEHVQGYTGTVDGIELGLTYGCEFAKTGPYGIRVFTLYEDDAANYDNEIYVYTGSVLNGDAKFEKQIDEPYPVYDNSFEMVVAYIGNIFEVIRATIVSLFS